MTLLTLSPGEAERREATDTLGMWVFIASEVLFFGALFVAHAVSRQHGFAGFAAASARTDVVAGTVNTAVLLTSSLAIAIAAEATRRGLASLAARALWAAAALGAVFLAIKGIEYHHEWQEHLFPGPAFALATPGAQLFFAWYFIVTALHAVHLSVGMGFAIAAARGSRREAPRVHAIALYWHFVDIVWVFLYPLIYLVAPRS